MSNKPLDTTIKKAGPSKPSAIAKQVLKTTPIPQPVKSSSSTPSNVYATNYQTQDTPRGKATQPLRSTKVSQKLVLFPQSDDAEATMQATLPVDSTDHFAPQRRKSSASFERPWQPIDQPTTPTAAAGLPLPIEWTFDTRTPAERMTKDERDLAGLPRAAAYCTGEGYDLTRLRPFLREHHRAFPRLYDECLYAAYHFPLRTLRPGKDNLHNVRVQSNLPKVSVDSRQNTMDEEYMDYEEDHYRSEDPIVIQPREGDPYTDYFHRQKGVHYDQPEEQQPLIEHREKDDDTYEEPSAQDEENLYNDSTAHDDSSSNNRPDMDSENNKPNEDQTTKPRELFKGGEVFIFDYGVVVFWNFRRAEELLMLEDFMQFSIEPFRDNPDEDMQIEEIHFQYDTSQMKPRIFNDMITLKSSNHMIKLTLSHGLSQSAVVARYEDIMDKTIDETKHLPKEMAETGRLGKTRTEITKINGQLFNLRMNVNLVSNVLDTPEIFWSEPALEPMYTAIREYLEIPQRAKILNDRLRVISDLLSMLRDHLTNFGVEYQTLIIIYLIIVAVIVACFEIAVKILQSLNVV
ncbi:hypothetical protein G6F70_008020 [Rhizopus microsporus]|uniref:DUF155-domain-containing protein n=1 Tax=Rhizopus microsporus TaxID=58291 RepID=A0A1X0RQS7_RHIZD|nr:hypothetical protein G6F71_007997 [Rhizopus microsporus]KAG1195723.1 hypothetical protein G6F70_008020 [Rhizopus microsporus]KAG1211130.1 hypothetical protein G6F69_004873 [Rhizopus microsporus]KAG1229093.1 hypothetical protein G6F67_007393 [Rhizopus microsporus]KAG1262686.1 hypothetical protein G6F68_005732 [Rhizopus microsporus]